MSGSPPCAGALVPEQPGRPMLVSHQLSKWESCSGEPKLRTQYLILVLSKKYWIKGEPSLSSISWLCLYYCSDGCCCPWLLPALRLFLHSCCPGRLCLACTAAWGSHFLGAGLFSVLNCTRPCPPYCALSRSLGMASSSLRSIGFSPQFDVICKPDRHEFCHATDEGPVTHFASVALYFVTAVLIEHKTLTAKPVNFKLIIQSVFTHP